MAVRLDPWQNIIEVGWGSRYIAMQVAFSTDVVSIFTAESCGDPVSVVPINEFVPVVSLQQMRAGWLYRANPGQYATGPADFQPETRQLTLSLAVWSGRWNGLAFGDVEITNVPTIHDVSAQSYAQWQYYHDSTLLSFSADGVEEPKAYVPGKPNVFFDQQPQQTLTRYLYALSNPSCREFEGVGGSTFQVGADLGDVGLPAFEHAVDFSGIRIEYFGRTYVPIASRHVYYTVAETGPFGLRNTIWLLFEPEEDTTS